MFKLDADFTFSVTLVITKTKSSSATGRTRRWFGNASIYPQVRFHI